MLLQEYYPDPNSASVPHLPAYPIYVSSLLTLHYVAGSQLVQTFKWIEAIFSILVWRGGLNKTIIILKKEANGVIKDSPAQYKHPSAYIFSCLPPQPRTSWPPARSWSTRKSSNTWSATSPRCCRTQSRGTGCSLDPEAKEYFTGCFFVTSPLLNLLSVGR